MTPSAPLVRVQGLTKAFGTFVALDAVDLEVQEGEVVCIIGPSGSGKSTLIRCINALEEHQQGTIEVDGTLLSSDLKNIDKIRSEVGMVFQSFNLFPHKSVFDNITLAQKVVRKRSTEDAKEKADFLLKKVGIHDKSGAYPDNLSGGQQQRVFLARALAQSADLYLLDEPLAGVDAATSTIVVTTPGMPRNLGTPSTLRITGSWGPVSILTMSSVSISSIWPMVRMVLRSVTIGSDRPISRASSLSCPPASRLSARFSSVSLRFSSAWCTVLTSRAGG